jgi:thiamine-phosphate pyrophosphorylase
MKDRRSYPSRPTSLPAGRINGGIRRDASNQRSQDTTNEDKAARVRRVIRGLYAITPDEADTAALVRMVESTLSAGTRLLQYRNKTADAALRREQLRALAPLCERYGCTLVVNDDWQAAIELGIRAVHIGGEDGDAAAVREAVGPEVILGVSCYASLERAAAVAPYADYLAFGSVFPSSTKPQAVSAALGLLGEARRFGKPVVAIGGINARNVGQTMDRGADAVAVISAVFEAEDVAKATEAIVGRLA